MLYRVEHPIDGDENGFTYDTGTGVVIFSGREEANFELYDDKPTSLFYKYKTLSGGKEYELCKFSVDYNTNGTLLFNYENMFPLLWFELEGLDGYCGWDMHKDSGMKFVESVNSSFRYKRFFLRCPYLVHDYVLKNGISIVTGNTMIRSGRFEGYLDQFI